MKVLQWTQEENEALQTYSPVGLERVDQSAIDPEAETERVYGTIDSFKAAWLRENATAWTAYQLGLKVGTGAAGSDGGPDWNPYAYMQENWDEERLKAHEFDIGKGLFDSAMSPADVEFKSARLAKERELMRAIAEGGALGAIGGSLAAAITDLTSYVPIAGQAGKLRTLPRIARYALIGMAGGALQEAALQPTQDLRTAEESFLNIGSATALGGGLGVFATFLNRANPNAPGHPLNELAPKNFAKTGLRVVRGDGAEDIIGPVDRSLSAAEAQVDVRPLQGLMTRSKLGSRLAEVNPLGRKTPIVRSLYRESPVVREAAVRLADTGGILTNLDRQGVSLGPSAEDLKEFYLQSRNLVFQQADYLIRETNVALARLGGTSRVWPLNRVKHSDFMEYTRKLLVDQFEDTDRQALESQYGPDAAKVIENNAKQLAERIHKVNNEEFEPALKRLGMLQDDQTIASLEKRLAEVRAEIKSARTALSAEQAQDGTTPTSTIDLDALRTERETLRRDLQVEKSKPRALGREYGYAQLWDTSSILEDMPGFKALLRDVVIDKPDDEWLEGIMKERNLELDDFDKLGKETVERVDGTEIAPEEGLRVRAQILEDWAGDAHHAAQRRAELDYESTNFNAKQARLDLTEALKDARVISNKADNVTLEQARSARNKIAQALRTAKDPQRVEKITRLLNEIDGKIARVESITAASKVAKARLAVARKAAAEAAKELKAAGRAVSAANKMTPLDKWIDEMTEAMVSRSSMPHPILDRVAVTTGRVKARRLHLDKAQRALAEQKGYLRTDLPDILNAQYEQLSSWLGLHEAFDIRPGGRYDSWTDVTKAIEEDYRNRIAQNPSRRAELLSEMKGALDDINGMKDRLLGTVDPGADRDGFLYWGVNRLLDFTYSKAALGLLWASLTDIAAVRIQSGPVGKLLYRHGRQAASTLMDLKKHEPSLFEASVAFSDMATHASRMMKMANADDYRDALGIGPRGSTRQRITSAIDTASGTVKRGVSHLSGLPLWNRSWRVIVGLGARADIAWAVRNYDSLTDLQRSILTSKGIGRAEAQRIAKMMDAHPGDNLMDIRFEDWHGTEEGRLASRDFRIALEKTMNRAVIVPGIGDRPLFMNKWWGKFLTTFQTFAFVFHNRILLPASQKLATFNDFSQLTNFAHMLFWAAVGVTAKDLSRGENPMSRFEDEAWQNTMFDVVDRAGMLSYVSPYADVALKLPGTQNLQEMAFGEAVIRPSSRYASNQYYESLLGANARTLGDVARFAGEASNVATGEGDAGALLEKGMRLTPINSYMKLMMNLSELD